MEKVRGYAMASDPKRIGQALEHIRRIKAGDYPVIMGNSAEAGVGYRIEEVRHESVNVE